MSDSLAALSAMDITALKVAERVTFHTHKGAAHIAAWLRSSDGRVYTRREQILFSDVSGGERMRSVECEHWAYGYGGHGDRGWNGESDPNYAAFASHVDRDVWSTVVGLLRVGDVLRLSWVASNNNQYCDDAGLHHDELRLRVQAGERVRAFLLCTSVGADNTARMIRQHG